MEVPNLRRRILLDSRDRALQSVPKAPAECETSHSDFEELTMTIENQGSVTHALENLKGGEHVDAAAQKLWEHAFNRLVRIARGMLRNSPRGVSDEEDTALSVFQSFCAGVAQGRFSDLGSRDNLWRVLYTIAWRKVSAQRAHERAMKRDAGRIVEVEMDAIPDDDPPPELLATLLDELRLRFKILRDDGLRQIARLLLEGLTNQEIAERLDCHVRTVERKRDLIRRAWDKEQSP